MEMAMFRCAIRKTVWGVQHDAICMAVRCPVCTAFNNKMNNNRSAEATFAKKRYNVALQLIPARDGADDTMGWMPVGGAPMEIQGVKCFMYPLPNRQWCVSEESTGMVVASGSDPETARQAAELEFADPIITASWLQAARKNLDLMPPKPAHVVAEEKPTVER